MFAVSIHAKLFSEWPLPFSGFVLRNWRSLEPRNVHLSTPPRKSPAKTSPTNPPASGVHTSLASLVCHADSRSSYCTASLQCCDGASEANVEGTPPSFSKLLAQTPPEHPPASRLPPPAT